MMPPSTISSSTGVAAKQSRKTRASPIGIVTAQGHEAIDPITSPSSSNGIEFRPNNQRCHELLRQTRVQADSVDHLRKLLNVANGAVVFTTFQKFMPEEKGGP
jgi:hypothetical protein